MNLRTIAVFIVTCHFVRGDKMMLFDFTDAQSVDDWREMSDTVRTVGKSKAVLTLQTSQLFQRAILFTLLNPQPNGAGFAGVRKPTNLDLSRFRDIEITCRGQGQNSHYKISLRHRGQNSNKDLSYEQFFTVPMSDDEFSTVTLPLRDFKPYYRGREIPDGEPLDTANITMFEFQIYGGVYLPVKQRGVSALEIETVAASS
ncbi:PREDICTED: uncharacterized protein LOC105453291 isoform X1 [Wasmannia auropunctata]|uniref:uncharacterized protein LOC105453291 isoform X1 n=1 Tax=Wasmannia auropunctata TaxID=64793 RepID=UPI0005EF14E2|nr:PREDICTED: uncharacterized protein LOC105453291 isoform X1 [Wasmannia auropunctata]